MPAEPQSGLEPQLEALKPELFEPQSLLAREQLATQVSQRVPTPESERTGAERLGEAVVRAGERLPGVGEQMLEPAGVELALGDGEPVTGAVACKPPGRKRPPELRDVHAENARRGTGRRSIPQRLDQRLGRQPLPRPQREHRKQPLRHRSQLERGSARTCLEAPEDAKLEPVRRLSGRRCSRPPIHLALPFSNLARGSIPVSSLEPSDTPRVRPDRGGGASTGRGCPLGAST